MANMPLTARSGNCKTQYLSKTYAENRSGGADIPVCRARAACPQARMPVLPTQRSRRSARRPDHRIIHHGDDIQPAGAGTTKPPRAACGTRPWQRSPPLRALPGSEQASQQPLDTAQVRHHNARKRAVLFCGSRRPIAERPAPSHGRKPAASDARFPCPATGDAPGHRGIRSDDAGTHVELRLAKPKSVWCSQIRSKHKSRRFEAPVNDTED